MIKTVIVEEFRANFDAVIADVEAGIDVTIVQNGRPIGTLAPTVVQRGIRYPLRDLQISPLEKPLGVDPVEVLIEERERERSGEKWKP